MAENRVDQDGGTLCGQGVSACFGPPGGLIR